MKRTIVLFVTVVLLVAVTFSPFRAFAQTAEWQDDEACSMKYEDLKSAWLISPFIKSQIPDELIQEYVKLYCADEVMVMIGNPGRLIVRGYLSSIGSPPLDNSQPAIS